MLNIRSNFLRRYSCLFFFFLSSTLSAQGLFQSTHQDNDVQPADVVHWYADPVTMTSQTEGEIRVRLKTDHDFTLYQDQLKFKSTHGLAITPTLHPTPKKVLDPISGEYKYVYDDGDFLLKVNVDPQDTEFALSVRYISCTSKICLFPYTEQLSIPIIRLSPTTKDDSTIKEALQDSSLEATLLEKFQTSSSIWLLICFAFLGGLLTNLTPCVYPMIPITLRLLSSQTQHPFLGSCSYAFGIMVTYTSLGSLAAATGSLFGSFMASPIVNILLAGLMSVFAVTMLGIFNFTAFQSLGNKIGQGQQGLKAAFFMGVGAGFIASPCTGPILAVLLGYAATQENTFEATLLLTTYSAGFASPYILLGNFASRVSRIKLADWTFTLVKTFFSGCMFALSFYYLRIPLYTYLNTLEPYWVQMCLGSGIIALVLFILQSLQKKSQALMTITAIVLGFFFFTCTRVSYDKSHIQWLSHEQQAYTQAAQENRPLLIDMWAEWCEACKKMEATTFTSPEVLDYLEENNWLLLKLDLTEDNPSTQDIQKRYKLGGLPTLVVIRPGQKEPILIPGYQSAEGLLLKLRSHL